MLEGLPGGRQAQREHVPADHLGARRQLEAQAVVRLAGAVGQRLHRQPFQPRAVGQAGAHRLQRGLAGAAVKARRAGRGDQRMAVPFQPRVQCQHVAADDAARRVHQHVVADGRAFGIQPLQHAQRAFMAVERAGAVAIVGVVQVQLGVPGHGRYSTMSAMSAMSAVTSRCRAVPLIARARSGGAAPRSLLRPPPPAPTPAAPSARVRTPRGRAGPASGFRHGCR